MKKITRTILFLLIMILIAVVGLHLRDLTKEQFDVAPSRNCLELLQNNATWQDITRTSDSNINMLLTAMSPTISGPLTDNNILPYQPCKISLKNLYGNYNVPTSLQCQGIANDSNALQFTGSNSEGYCLFDFTDIGSTNEAQRRLKLTADVIAYYKDKAYHDSANRLISDNNEKTQRLNTTTAELSKTTAANVQIQSQIQQKQSQINDYQNKQHEYDNQTNIYAQTQASITSASQLLNDKMKTLNKINSAWNVA